MDKIKEIKHRLPNLKAAIQLYGPYEPYVKRDDGYYRVCFIQLYLFFLEIQTGLTIANEPTITIGCFEQIINICCLEQNV